MFCRGLVAAEENLGAWDASHRVFLLGHREPFIEEQCCLSIPQHFPHSIITATAMLWQWERQPVKYFSWLEVNPSSHAALGENWCLKASSGRTQVCTECEIPKSGGPMMLLMPQILPGRQQALNRHLGNEHPQFSSYGCLLKSHGKGV